MADAGSAGARPDTNPYRYCGNGPTDGIDPRQPLIEITARHVRKCRERLDDYDIKGVGIQNRKSPLRSITRPFLMAQTYGNRTSVRPSITRRMEGTKEMLAAMIKSPRWFVVDGDTGDKAMKNLDSNFTALRHHRSRTQRQIRGN